MPFQHVEAELLFAAQHEVEPVRFAVYQGRLKGGQMYVRFEELKGRIHVAGRERWVTALLPVHLVPWAAHAMAMISKDLDRMKIVLTS